jgi:hypothetical protein
VEWIPKAWKDVQVNIIPKSFLKSCSSNMEYGTHDDVLWNGSGQTGEGASSSQNET